MRSWLATLVGRPGDRPADRGDRGGRRGRQCAGATRRAPRRGRRRAPAGGQHRHRAGRRTVDRRGDRLRPGHRDPATGDRGRAHQHRHRLHHDHGARRHPVHPHRSDSDRWPLPRHHRTGAARRDLHRGVHRHARPVGARDRAGAQRVGTGGRPGVGRHHATDAGPAVARPVAVDRSGRTWGTWRFRFVGVWAIRRRLLRQTHGLRPDELRVMYEHHDAILHSVSEGLVVLDGDRVVLVNDEARRLLALPAAEGRRVGSAGVPAQLRTRRARRAARDRRAGAGGEPVEGRGLGALGGGDDSRPHRIAGRAGRTELAAGAGRLAARAGARGREQAAHRDHHGGAGQARGRGRVRDRGVGAVPSAWWTGCPRTSANPLWWRCSSARPHRPTNVASR